MYPLAVLAIVPLARTVPDGDLYVIVSPATKFPVTPLNFKRVLPTPP